MNNQSIDSNIPYLVEIEIQQPTNIKTLFTVVKEQLVEGNLIFTKEGLSILATDSTKIVLVYVVLEADNFANYKCVKPIKIGVEMNIITKILKSISSTDILTILVKNQLFVGGDCSDDQATLGFKIENKDKGEVNMIWPDTLDVDDDEDAGYPDLNYPIHIDIPSSDLQNIMARLKNMSSDKIRIRYQKKQLSFYTKGEHGTSEIKRYPTNKGETSINIHYGEGMNDNSSDIIDIYVKLQKMVEFAKCQALSSTATMYLSDSGLPVFLEYDVGNLGRIKLGVSQCKKPDDWD